ALYARRHGRVPGPYLWCGIRMCDALGAGFGPPTDPAGATRDLAGRSDSVTSGTPEGGLTMQQQDWVGVFPAITTPFNDDLTVDHARLAKHVGWLIDQGCRGIVALGSLGESATLTVDEKMSILETCKRALEDRAPLVAGIAGLSTTECVSLAKRAAHAGCDGLMVLPPYVYRGDWRESKAHFD